MTIKTNKTTNNIAIGDEVRVSPWGVGTIKKIRRDDNGELILTVESIFNDIFVARICELE